MKTAKTVKKVEKPTKVTTATLPKTGVNVWNYNEWTHFPTRKKALDYYNRAARGSEGSERDRYFNIICQLEEGGINVSDGDYQTKAQMAEVTAVLSNPDFF